MVQYTHLNSHIKMEVKVVTEILYGILFALLLIAVVVLMVKQGGADALLTWILLMLMSALHLFPLYKMSVSPQNMTIIFPLTLGMIAGLIALIFGKKEIKIGVLSYYLSMVIFWIFVITLVA